MMMMTIMMTMLIKMIRNVVIKVSVFVPYSRTSSRFKMHYAECVIFDSRGPLTAASLKQMIIKQLFRLLFIRIVQITAFMMGIKFF